MKTGPFAGEFSLGRKKLVATMDGVGTKVLLALESGLEACESVGGDLVRHCINDLLCAAGRPLFFLDYIGSDKIALEYNYAFLEGIRRECERYDISLIGGETAHMKSVYRPNTFEIVGTLVGERKRGLKGNIEQGDFIIGLLSNGLHTNGYSFATEYLGSSRDKFSQALLAEHTCYYDDLFPLMKRAKAYVHITGGGIRENVSRVLPRNLNAVILWNHWRKANIFSILPSFKDNNDGIGMIAIVSSKNKEIFIDKIPNAWIIGNISKGSGKVV